MFTEIYNIFQWIYCLCVNFVHGVIKLFMRKVTRLTELQRIIYGELRGCRRFRKVEESLNHSRNPEVKTALLELDRGLEDGRFRTRGTRRVLLTQCAIRITKAKNINIKLHARFLTALTECLEVIYAFKALNSRVTNLRETEYSTANPEHETKLLQLWENMMHGEKLSARKSRQWQELGFQGTDPATDFRGAGLLSLETLLFISNSFPEVAQRLLENSHHPRYSYPYALLVIQIAYLGCQLCHQGFAKTHFYNRYPTLLRLDDDGGPADPILWEKELLTLFYELCTSLVIDFDALWMSSKPKDIMEYSRIKSMFDVAVLQKLRLDDTCFLMEYHRHYVVGIVPEPGGSIASFTSEEWTKGSFTSFELVYHSTEKSCSEFDFERV